jgi:hypothetical protein
VGDLDRQEAIDQAAGGCFVAVALLGLVAVASALVALDSTATRILAALLILGGVGLAMVHWAAR